MGYNIGDASGNAVGGGGNNNVDTWTFTGDLRDSDVTVITGDFDQMTLSGSSTGEAPGGYAAGPLSTPAFGTLTFNTADGRFQFAIDRQAVLATGTDQVVSFRVTGTNGSGGTDMDTVFLNLMVCVARGTRIATDRGAVQVEDLRCGDMAITRDEGAQPIRWIGSRRICGAELSADPDLRPICIRAGALGDGAPRQDLWVSAQHRILQAGWRAALFCGEDEVLVPARALVDGDGIARDLAATEVEYFHILFDRHQIIDTNGAATESFLPGRWSLNTLSLDSRTDLFRLYPHLARNVDGYGPPARPLVKMRDAVLFAGGGADSPAARMAA